MGTINTLAADASYEDLAADLTYTLVRCEARPLTAGLAPSFVALLGDVNQTSDQERQHTLTVLRAEELVALTDEDIDVTVDAVVNTILTITGGDRDHDLYRHYLGHQRPRDLKLPIHGDELTTVRAWVPSLLTSPHPGLAALGPVLQLRVGNADDAIAERQQAAQALKDFRQLGPRRALVDKINARRKATYGDLGEIAHSNPQANLPADFADRFFRHEHRRRRKATVKELTEKLAAAQAVAKKLEIELAQAEVTEKAAADARAKQEAEALQKKVADAEKKAADAAAAVAALKGEGEPTGP